MNLFDAEQKEVIQNSYRYGKSMNLGHTLAAISIVESSAGKQKTRFRNDASFGHYHILLKTAFKRLGADTEDEQIQIVLRLYYDQRYGANLAITELLYWKQRHYGDWKKMVASYNAGNSWENGKNYVDKVSYYVLELQHCKLD
jgi:hypothetical protein